MVISKFNPDYDRVKQIILEDPKTVVVIVIICFHTEQRNKSCRIKWKFLSPVEGHDCLVVVTFFTERAQKMLAGILWLFCLW